MVLPRLVRSLSQQARQKLLVIYGSQTGTAESLARMLGPQALGHNLMPVVMPMNEAVAHLKKETPAAVACVCSTYGTGEFPSNAEKFFEAAAELPLQGVKYSILGLGDSSHERFNTAALALDDAFRKAGAVSLQKIVLSDETKGHDGSYREWKRGLWKALGSDVQGSVDVVYELLPVSKKPECLEAPGFTRATVLSNDLVSAPGYEPAFRKLSFEFETPPRVDDHVLVLPRNDPELVERAARRLAVDPYSIVNVAPLGGAPKSHIDGKTVFVRTLLAHVVDLSGIPPRSFLEGLLLRTTTSATSSTTSPMIYRLRANTRSSALVASSRSSTRWIGSRC